MYIGWCFLDQGRRYSNSDPEDTEVLLKDIYSPNYLGYTGVSLDDFNGTNRMQSLSDRWGKDLKKVINKISMLDIIINTIKNFWGDTFKKLNELFKEFGMNRDKIEYNWKAPYPYIWIETPPLDFGGKQWLNVINYVGCTDKEFQEFTQKRKEWPKLELPSSTIEPVQQSKSDTESNNGPNPKGESNKLKRKPNRCTVVTNGILTDTDDEGSTTKHIDEGSNKRQKWNAKRPANDIGGSNKEKNGPKLIVESLVINE